jgi:hypothetical protein
VQRKYKDSEGESSVDGRDEVTRPRPKEVAMKVQ